MAISIGVVVSWIAITFFSLIPKRLSLLETIFLFCANTVFELSVFSILHINLKLIDVEPGLENGIANLMFRLIELPLLLVASSTILLYSAKYKWWAVTAIILFTLIVQQALLSLGILSFNHWNLFYSGLGMCLNVLFSRTMTWVITSVERKVTA